MRHGSSSVIVVEEGCVEIAPVSRLRLSFRVKTRCVRWHLSCQGASKCDHAANFFRRGCPLLAGVAHGMVSDLRSLRCYCEVPNVRRTYSDAQTWSCLTRNRGSFQDGFINHLLEFLVWWVFSDGRMYSIRVNGPHLDQLRPVPIRHIENTRL